MSDEFHWRDLLPNPTSVIILVVAVVVIEYLLTRGLL